MLSIVVALLLLAALAGIGWVNYQTARRTARRLLDLAGTSAGPRSESPTPGSHPPS